MMTRIALAGLAATLLVPAAGLSPAAAQYYDEGYYDRPRPYYDGRPRYRGRFGRVCVTSRGACMSDDVLPFNAPCACTVPGFGIKHGQIGG